MSKKQQYFCQMNLDACRDFIADLKYNVKTTPSGYRYLDRTGMHPCPNTLDGAMKAWGNKYINLTISTKKSMIQKTYACDTYVKSHGDTPIEAIYKLIINLMVYNNPALLSSRE